MSSENSNEMVNKPRFKLRKNFIALTIVLFSIEVLIALYVHDNFVRPYLGDLLVVILIYSFVRSFLNISYKTILWGVLLFSYAIEALQYVGLVNLLGLQESKVARIVIGTSFAWVDIIMYTAGILIVFWVESVRAKNQFKSV
jgi:DNA integrity scanning protein DisA with diadenylate cyclase activity